MIIYTIHNTLTTSHINLETTRNETYILWRNVYDIQFDMRKENNSNSKSAHKQNRSKAKKKKKRKINTHLVLLMAGRGKTISKWSE